MRSPRGFARQGHAALVVGMALGVGGCGDGVGQPIRKDTSLSDGDPASSVEYCRSVQDWDATAQRDEDTVAASLGALRILGPGCGFQGGGQAFGGAASVGGGPSSTVLAVSPELRCSARRHSRDMAERGYVGEVTPEGETAGTRLRLAGYRTSAAAEVVVKDPSPASVVATVLRAECTKLSDPRWVAVGVGKFQDLWTMDLAGNRDP